MIDPDALLDALYDFGLDTTVVEEGTEVTLACPLCADTNKRLYIEAESGAWICFRCQERGDVFDLFHRVLGLEAHDAFEAKRRLRIRPEARFRFAQETPRQPQSVEIPEEFEPFVPEDIAHARFLMYLHSRGVPGPRARAYNMMICRRGPYAERVIVPVTYGGTLYTWIARDITGQSDKKYLTPLGGRPSETLFNLERIEKLDPKIYGPVYIVEGVFDTLRLFNASVAILGSSISTTQLMLLARLNTRWRPFIVMLDGDEAGRKASHTICKALWGHGLPFLEARLPEGVDPATATDEQIVEATRLDNSIRWMQK